MTKKQTIEDLVRQGKGGAEIAVLTGYSSGYIRNVTEEMRRPGILRKRVKKFLAKFGGARQYLKTTEVGGDGLRRRKKVNLTNHQNATRPLARNHRQSLTIREIEYIEQHGKKKSIRQLALDLGRTYGSVQQAAHKFGIDLRGDKMGANANRFREIYAQKAVSPVTTIS